MSSYHHVITQVRRRRLINSAARSAGWGLLLGCVASVILLGVDRMTTLASIPAYFLGAIAAAGLIGGAAYALLKIDDRFNAALELDRTLGLKDRLATAQTLEVAWLSEPPPQVLLARRAGLPYIDREFAALVVRDADQVSQRVDVRSAAPIRVGGIWSVAGTAAAALALGVLFLPQMIFGRGQQIAAAQAAAQQVHEQANLLAQSIQQTVRELPPREQLDDAARAHIDALERLAQQLQAPATDRELAAARDESAARMNEISQRLAEQAQREQAAAQELARRFAGIDAAQAPKPPMSAEEFSQALQRGEFGEALRSLDQLMEHQSDLPRDEQRDLAEHLRELGELLKQRAAARDIGEQERAEQLTHALREHGMDEQDIQELLQQQSDDPQRIEEELRRQSNPAIDEELARRMARDVQQMHKRQQLDEQVQRDAEDLAQALNQTADEFDPPTTTPTPPTRPTTPTPPTADKPSPRAEEADRQAPREASRAQQDKSQQRSDQTQGDKTQSQTEGTQRQPQPQQKPGPGEQTPGTEQPQPSASPQSDQKQSQQQQRDRQQTTDPTASSQASDDQAQPTQADRTAGEPAASEQRHAQESQSRQVQSQQNQSQQSRSQPNQSQQDASQAGDQRQGARETLRRLAQRQSGQGQSQDQQQASERLRQMARQLAQQNQSQQQPGAGMTPEQNQQWVPPDGALSGARDVADDALLSDGVRRTPADVPARASEPLDLREQTPPKADQVLAQWLSEAEQTTGDPASVGAAGAGGAGGDSSQHIRRAQEVAQRAVNEAAVHKRYHRSIMRYFGRLEETVEKAAGKTGEERK